MVVVKSVFPVIFMLLAGMFVRKKKIISEDGMQGLQALVMNVTLPLGLFGAFYKAEITGDVLILPFTFFILVTFGIFAARLLCRLFHERDFYVPFMASGYEFGMLGYALIAILAGHDNITTFAIMDIGQCLAIFTVYSAMLSSGAGKRQSVKKVLTELLTTPVLVAILAGSFIAITNIGSFLVSSGSGELIDTVCSFASAPTSAVILTVIGYRMNFSGINWKKVFKACSIRILLQFVFLAAVLFTFRIIGGICSEPLTIKSVILAIILPPPFILPLYIKNEQNKEFFSLAISAYTLISIAAFTILIAIYS